MTTEAKVHYVILSIDALSNTRSDDACLRMPTVGEWTETEHDDDSDEWEYLGDNYAHCRHRKYVAALTESELDAWLKSECTDRQEARENGEPTAGMITGEGWLPAYALIDDPMDWNIGGITQVIDRNAYVGEYALASEDQIPASARLQLSELYGMEAS
jgi:hypothetical protein